MHLLQLPVEVGMLILKFLDVKSKISVYNSCNGLRRFFAVCHVKKVVLSRSSIASIKTLDEELFLNYGGFIQELDLSGVPNLTVDNLKPHVSRWEQLTTLNITFTNIYLDDIDVICPKNLKNISINFFKRPRKSKLNKIWDICIEIFKKRHFNYILFVVFEFLDSDLPQIFLEDVPMSKELTITVADNYKDFWEIEDDVTLNFEKYIDVHFTKLTYLFRDCRVTHKTSKYLRGVSNLDFKDIEYIFIMYLEKIVIFVSPAFRDVFAVNCSDLRVEMSPYLPLDFLLDGNIIFKSWNKAATVFNDEFFSSLLRELKDYFPSYVCMHNKITMNITKAPSNWYCIDSCEGFEQTLDDLPENVTLTDFCRKDGVVLRCSKPITLAPDSGTLQRITFLRLSNVCVKEDFFAVLLSQCSKLNTLDIYVEKRGHLGAFRGFSTSLSKSIHLANCLRNFKITSEDIEYEVIFDTLSRCLSLENVHICEYERAMGDNIIVVDNIVKLIEKCDNLYSLFIEADMLPESLTMLMSPLREVSQKLGKDHLCIEVCDCYRGWNPFVDVFNPSPLHILD